VPAIGLPHLERVALAVNLGFGPVELRRVQRLVAENRTLLMEKWHGRTRVRDLRRMTSIRKLKPGESASQGHEVLLFRRRRHQSCLT
jgi:hypothetical protein